MQNESQKPNQERNGDTDAVVDDNFDGRLTRTHLHTYLYAYIYINKCIPIYMYINDHVHMCICTVALTYINAYICIKYVSTGTYINAYINKFIYTYIFTYPHMNAYIHKYIHTHTYRCIMLMSTLLCSEIGKK